ncbi:MAG: flagellar motor switch protein FliM [Defluviitaleaceae bacterium]|nr:flagellar motor switch protein FliM [Defluviitaleaceae bacterium]
MGGDVLSQEEIDALLNAYTSGNQEDIPGPPEATGPIASDYNFSRPSKFNREQLRTLEVIFDNYSRELTSFLTGYLRSTVEIEVINSEQITYKDFSMSLANPTILSIVDFEPFKGSIILEMSSNVGYAIIDRILGGQGLPLSGIRELSDIEKILLERVFSQMLGLIPEAWEKVAVVNPRLTQIETNVQFAQVLPPNEMTALITLDVSVGSAKGFVNFCIPHVVIAPISQKLSSTNWFSSAEDYDENSHYKQQLEYRLENTFVDVSAVVGRTTIMVSDFVNMQTGDIIPLDSYINSNFSVMVGNLLKFNAKPGISRGKNAVQITSLIRRED